VSQDIYPSFHARLIVSAISATEKTRSEMPLTVHQSPISGSVAESSPHARTTNFDWPIFSQLSAADTRGLEMPPVLSSQGLERAVSISEGDFAFVGNNCNIQCTQFQAAYISPRVHSLLQKDRTADSLFVECQPQKMDERRVFEYMGQLLHGLPIEPLDSELGGVLEIATFLENRELAAQLLYDDLIDKSNVCSRLKKKFAVGTSVTEEIEFAAAHFHELEFEQLRGIDACILEAILSSDSLRLQDEDSLLTFICSVDSESQILLLRYVRSAYLSWAGMATLLDLVPDFGMDPLIWTLVCPRLCLPVSGGNCSNSTTEESRCDGTRTVDIRLDHTESPSRFEALDGIISYLTTKCGENVHEKGLVTITSKSRSPWETPLSAVVDLLSGSCFFSEKEPRQWICWDFHEMRVRPTHYTIYAMSLGPLVVEGSVDGENWTEIDRHTDAQEIGEGRAETRSFEVLALVDCRFIRFTQTGETSYGSDALALTAVEFFGRLSE
jgi:hypothetical protein